MDINAAMDRVLNALSEGASLKEACYAAGVSPGAHYHWLKTNRPYKEGYEFACRLRTRLLEDVLTTRAISGYDETKITTTLLTDGSGNVIAEIPTEKVTVHKYDNNLALRLLAANDDKFNPKRMIEIEDKSKKSIAEILSEARNRLAAGTGVADAEESN